jgi:scyllo-inositol 2-dehydrogenase (NADP+)
MRPLRWAIIGPGNIAHEFARDLQLVENSRHVVSAVVSHTLESAREFAQEENVPRHYDNIHEFLSAPDVDVVYVATPHNFHHEQTILCLEKNLPVLCEKPLAVNAAQVSEMVKASKENNTFLMEGMWVRFLPSINKLIHLIDKGIIGKIVCIKADMSYVAPKDSNNRFFNPDLAGGSLLDLGIYPVFLSLLLKGKPEKITATGRLSDKGIDETCAAFLQYPDGSYSMLESSIITQTPLEAIVYGELGAIKIAKPWNEKPASIVVQLNDGTIVNHPCEWQGRGFQYEIEEVSDCLSQQKLSSNKFCHSFSIDLIETMDEIRKQVGIVYPFE